MTNRRGFTLVELLVSLTLVLIAIGAAYRLLIASQRVSRQQAEQATMQSNVRIGSLILPGELREIGYDSNQVDNKVTSDLLEIDANRIRFRAMRGIGIVCAISTTELHVRDPIFGLRNPRLTDSLLLFLERNENLALDDEWMPLGISDIDLASTCGADPAIKLTLMSAIPGGLIPSLTVGSPLRFFEHMEIGLYAVDGRSWLGARAALAEGAYQPVLGPLADGNGVEFKYFNASGIEVPVTGDRRTVRSIKLTIRGQSAQAVSAGGSGGLQIAADSLITKVALRNVLRP